jgi:flagellar protein FliS
MHLQSGYSGGARARYQAIDVNSLVDGASPHRLVTILFDELMKSIDIMLAAQRAGNRAKVIEKQARAALVLLTLETTLDFKNGGDLALNLARIYREGRRLLQLGVREADTAPVEQAKTMLGGIAEAWRQIA